MRNEADIQSKLYAAEMIEANNRLLPDNPLFKLTEEEAQDCRRRAAEYGGWVKALRWVLGIVPEREGTGGPEAPRHDFSAEAAPISDPACDHSDHLGLCDVPSAGGPEAPAAHDSACLCRECF